MPVRASIILLFSIVYSLQAAYGQNLKKDPYAQYCLKFSWELNSSDNLSKLEEYFDEEIQSDSLTIKLSKLRDKINNNREDINFYIVKSERPTYFFYNIHIYNIKTIKSYGDMRIVFKDTSDFLIDDWIYLKEAKEEIKQNNLPALVPPLPSAPF